MNVTIDKAGRIVVPKEFRQRLGLHPNMELELVDHPNGLLLRVADAKPSLIKINGLLVHHGRAEPGAELTRTVELAREERIRGTIRG
jgi:AbrB family looped-hinge helix DNA binding protein